MGWDRLGFFYLDGLKKMWLRFLIMILILIIFEEIQLKVEKIRIIICNVDIC